MLLRMSLYEWLAVVLVSALIINTHYERVNKLLGCDNGEE